MIGQNYIYEKDEDNAYFSVVGDDLAVLSDRKLNAMGNVRWRKS